MEINPCDDGSPLAMLLTMMREAKQANRIKEAIECARAAAPYIHPRAGALGQESDMLSDEQLQRTLDAIAADDETLPDPA